MISNKTLSAWNAGTELLFNLNWGLPDLKRMGAVTFSSTRLVVSGRCVVLDYVDNGGYHGSYLLPFPKYRRGE